MNKTLSDFQDRWVHIVDKGCNDYNALTADERIWFSTQALLDAVNNGGLISHYYNSGADHNSETIADLMTLGLPRLANMLIALNELFPGGHPSKDIEERNEVINEWGHNEHEALMDRLDQEFYAEADSLEKWLVDHIEKTICST